MKTYLDYVYICGNSQTPPNVLHVLRLCGKSLICSVFWCGPPLDNVHPGPPEVHHHFPFLFLLEEKSA